MAAAAPPSYQLSTELRPPHEGGVQALAVLNNDTLVSGGDDRMVTVWRRIGATKGFASAHMCAEHESMIRAILPVPACEAIPTGGFVTAALDKKIRVYSVVYMGSAVKVDLIRTLEGHMMGVISLSWTNTGMLISGGWEGHVRVWDLTTGTCRHVLEGHENGTCVLGLPNGDIVVGSTGRKNERNQHVDFKIRVWRPTPSANGQMGYTQFRVLEDHDQAIRGLALLADVHGGGWASVGNDGAVKLRDPDGTVRQTFVNPHNAEGKPYSCYKVAVMSSTGAILTSNEDLVVRVYRSTGDVVELAHPGQPWAAEGMPNGDIATASNQAGTSKRGHVYVWTQDASRYADELCLAQLAQDLVPPAKPRAPQDDGSIGEGIEISGDYEARMGVQGTSDGQYGFFRQSDGSVMVCAWSAAAGAWTDVGIMQDGPSSGSPDGESNAAGRGASRQQFDYNLGVTLDTAGGVRSMQLNFNEQDDPNEVARKFLDFNGLDMDNFEEVRNFILTKKTERAAERRRVAAVPQYKHFPSLAYIELSSADWSKVWPKLLSFLPQVRSSGAADVSSLSLDAAQEASLKSLVDVLAQTSRYHSSVVPRQGVHVLFDSCLRWPLECIFPALDILRVLLTHPDGAIACADVAGATIISNEIARINASKHRQDLRAVVLISARVLFNMFRHEPTRLLAVAQASPLLDIAADLLQYEHTSVRLAATALIHNLAHYFIQKVKAQSITADQATPESSRNIWPADDKKQIDHLVAVILEGLSAVTDEDAVYNLVIAFGSALLVGPAVRKMARDMDALSVISKLDDYASSSSRIKEASRELTTVLSAG